MKKLLLVIGLVSVASLAFGQAQNRQLAQSFFVGDVSTVCVSNAVASGGYAHGVTNFNSYGYGVTHWMSNTIGTTWTNAANVRQISLGAGSVALDFKNLLADCDVSTLSKTLLPIGDTATAAATNFTFCTIYIRVTAGAGANAAVTFIFYPVFDDAGTDIEDTGTKISVAVTASGVTPVTSVTRVPAFQIWGAKKIRLASITNADADADSRVNVLECKLLGYQ